LNGELDFFKTAREVLQRVSRVVVLPRRLSAFEERDTVVVVKCRIFLILPERRFELEARFGGASRHQVELAKRLARRRGGVFSDRFEQQSFGKVAIHWIEIVSFAPTGDERGIRKTRDTRLKRPATLVRS